MPTTNNLSKIKNFFAFSKKYFHLKNLIGAFIFLALAPSCSSNETYDNPYPNFQQQNYSNQYRGQPQYWQQPNQPQYQQPYVQQQYQPNYPNSRAYSNPYAFPQQYYPTFYDSDQYYVPPTNYYNIERPQGGSGVNKF